MIENKNTRFINSRCIRLFRTHNIFAIAVLVLALATANATWSQAVPRVVDLGQLTFEDAEVDIRLTSANTGFVVAKCIGCNIEVDTLRLTLDEDSKALLNHQEISFAEAMQIPGGFHAVIYDPYTMRLVKLSIVTDL